VIPKLLNNQRRNDFVGNYNRYRFVFLFVVDSANPATAIMAAPYVAPLSFNRLLIAALFIDYRCPIDYFAWRGIDLGCVIEILCLLVSKITRKRLQD